MVPRSVPQLYAMAHGVACIGSSPCFYCGAPCGPGSGGDVSVYVKDSFTGRSEVVAPGSPFVCAGCVLCLREDATVQLIDGTARHVAKCAIRSWSWLVTETATIAASKAHIRELRSVCLAGDGGNPGKPWALVLSDSGQKHLLYRGVVNHGGPPWRVTLEVERIDYTPESLAARLRLCGQLIAATGKPALAEPLTPRFAGAVMERYQNGETLVEDWSRVCREPLSRLAAWLSPKKEDCKHEHPSDRVSESAATPVITAADSSDPGRGSISEEVGGTCRPRPHDRRERATRDPRAGQGVLFDLG